MSALVLKSFNHLYKIFKVYLVLALVGALIGFGFQLISSGSAVSRVVGYAIEACAALAILRLCDSVITKYVGSVTLKEHIHSMAMKKIRKAKTEIAHPD